MIKLTAFGDKQMCLINEKHIQYVVNMGLKDMVGHIINSYSLIRMRDQSSIQVLETVEEILKLIEGTK